MSNTLALMDLLFAGARQRVLAITTRGRGWRELIRLNGLCPIFQTGPAKWQARIGKIPVAVV